jgi:hypothetical protein
MNHNHAIQLIEQIQEKFENQYPSIQKEDFSGDVSDFNAFAKSVEKILNLEAKYYQFIEKRNKRIKEHFLDSDPMQWKSLKQSLAKQAQAFGSWIIKKDMNVDSKLLDKISESREAVTKEDSLLDTKDKEKQSSGNKWV